jgi:hypothetical protein
LLFLLTPSLTNVVHFEPFLSGINAAMIPLIDSETSYTGQMRRFALFSLLVRKKVFRRMAVCYYDFACFDTTTLERKNLRLEKLWEEGLIASLGRCRIHIAIPIFSTLGAGFNPVGSGAHWFLLH